MSSMPCATSASFSSLPSFTLQPLGSSPQAGDSRPSQLQQQLHLLSSVNSDWSIKRGLTKRGAGAGDLPCTLEWTGCPPVKLCPTCSAPVVACRRDWSCTAASCCCVGVWAAQPPIPELQQAWQVLVVVDMMLRMLNPGVHEPHWW